MSEENKPDIERLVASRLPQGLEKLVSTLLDRSHNVFLWVDLVLKQIERHGAIRARSEAELLLYIDDIPKELSGLYQYLIHQTHEDDRTEACDLFLLIHVSKTPLTIDEVRSMLEVSKGSGQALHELKGVTTDARVQTLSYGLVEFRSTNGSRGHLAQFFHKPFGDFLVK
ncbi:hypothetical protein ACHAQH_006568 [Verticillium albo-atrum]